MVAVLVVAILVLLSQGILHSLNYFETVDQALAQRASLGTKVIRLEGLVKSGSIERTSSGAKFVITGSKGDVDVSRARFTTTTLPSEHPGRRRRTLHVGDVKGF